jgi:hypothetical protein
MEVVFSSLPGQCSAIFYLLLGLFGKGARDLIKGAFISFFLYALWISADHDLFILHYSPGVL